MLQDSEIAYFITASVVLLLILLFFFVYLVVINQRKLLEKRSGVFESILETQEKERERFARDLHDELGPVLSAAKLSADKLKSLSGKDPILVEQVSRLHELLDLGVRTIRSTSYALMPPDMEEGTLSEALVELCNRLNRAGETNIEMELDGLPNDLSNASALNIYRLIQEVISNSLKHGKAKKIEVLSFRTDNFLFLEINDNGAGFDSENQRQHLPGLGLKNIGNRVRYLQGKFEVNSSKGQGTKIKLKFDLDKLP